MAVLSLASEFNMDIDYFKMITDYYDRKCPCWGGKYTCPCPPFVGTKKCKCGAVRALDDPKGRKSKYKTYRIDFPALVEIVERGYRCPEDDEKVCLCGEFLESGNCRLGVFSKIESV